MNLSPWPEWLNDTWAKSSIEEGQPGENLAKHTQLVLERLADLARLRPQLTTFLSAPRLWHCLFWACFLHDFGKVAHGFQRMVQDKNKNYKWNRRHEVLSLAFLDWIAPSFSQIEQRWLLVAIASHHKDADDIKDQYAKNAQLGLVEDMLAQIDEETVRGLWRWISECSASWIAALELHSFSVQPIVLVEEDVAIRMICSEGVQRTYNWIQIYRAFMKHLPTEHDATIVSTLVMLRGLTTTSDHSASAHLDQISPGIQRSWEDFDKDLKVELRRKKKDQNREVETYAHQSECAINYAISALLIAPTGTGKTEAALYWAMGDGSEATPRIFYTLPYQASMNAMHLRLSKPYYFGDKKVGLQHGRALQTLYRHQLDAETGPSTASELARWATNLNRLHAYPVKVFSPYQMLKVPFQIKGFEGMLADYTQAAFIFDEIHAYDAKRLALILALVKHLRLCYGARFLVMSATLPSFLGKIMPDILGSEKVIVAKPELFKDFRRHHLIMLDGDLLEQGIDSIVNDVRNGKSVLVCCNTVQRAQNMYAALQFALSPEHVALLHGRFTMEDRLKHENDVISRCAKGSEAGPFAIVATQVVEVSLDIDLDTIYSDPAPLDALIQRFGRVNRARLKGIVPVHVFREPRDGQGIYLPLLVQRTIDELERHNDTDIDEAEVKDWLDTIYDAPEIRDPWNDLYSTQFANAEIMLRDLRPFNSDKQREEKFEELFDGAEVLPSRFEERYLKHLKEKEFIEASQLFVSISYKRFRFLRFKGKIRTLIEDKDKKSNQWITTLPYGPKLGLQLDDVVDAYMPDDES